MDSMNREPDRRPESPQRRRVRALSDSELLAEMRAKDPWAWGEFDARFKPLLEEYAWQTGIPKWEWDECIQEVLDDEALRLTSAGIRSPDRLRAYLVQAVRHRHLAIKRARQRGERRGREALDCDQDEKSPHAVLRTLCSAYALRGSAPGGDPGEEVSPALARLATEIENRATDEERQLLHWLGQKVGHGQIAAWLGVSYDAASKRLWRLCKRLRTEVSELVRSLPAGEREEAERYLRRALARRATIGPDKGREATHDWAAPRRTTAPQREHE